MPHTLASRLNDCPRGRVTHSKQRHAVAGCIAWSYGILAEMAAAVRAAAATVDRHAADLVAVVPPAVSAVADPTAPPSRCWLWRRRSGPRPSCATSRRCYVTESER